MYHTPSPRGEGDGYQLDEIGLFGATRCATCDCAACGHTNFRGLSIEQITKYLKDKGYIVEAPADATELVQIQVAPPSDEEGFDEEGD